MQAASFLLSLTLGVAGPIPAPSASTDAPAVERIPAGTPVTLDALLDRALSDAPDVRQALVRVELGEAEIEGARPLLPRNPELWLGIGGRHTTRGLEPEVQAQLTQPLEIARERQFRLRSAQAERRALLAEAHAAQWSNAVEIRAGFRRALLAKRRVEMAQRVRAFAARIVSTTQTLVDAGEESPLRLRLAEAQLADARQAVVEAAFEYRSAANRLARAAGWTDGWLEPMGELPDPVAELSPDLEELVAEHPAVQAAEASLRAARAGLEAANREAWPEPSVGASVLYERDPGAAYSAVIGLGIVSLPLPIWQRNQAGRARARAELRIAQTDLAVTQQVLRRDLERAVDGLVSSAARLRTYTDEILPRFSENLELIERSFELGEIDVLEVFVAQERFMTLQRRGLDVYEGYIESMRRFEAAAATPFAPG